MAGIIIDENCPTTQALINLSKLILLVKDINNVITHAAQREVTNAHQLKALEIHTRLLIVINIIGQLLQS